ncbi:sigma-70 family RNA polymerase sigma factor [Coprobacillus sp. AF13-15]|nr:MULTISPECIES: sigma factor-like helix-turn-helix DNA-binding protein [Faecalibacillus]RHS05967.1 sigma-70 family RNA polymerase sigma factor [Coprobacillus sp. AF13-4LB]RHS14213.1 sigma-70 family RNA polymerase sigma factor [Coprobacillus sp. AF13-15]
MKYNYEKEKLRWEKDKLLEEKLLKKNNVNHSIINMLRNYDWNDFKRERSFKTHQNVTKDVFFDLKATYDEKEINSINDLMDEIENENLYKILSKEDNITLKILVYKIQGYSTKEIANILGITIDNIYYRIKKIRKKIK